MVEDWLCNGSAGYCRTGSPTTADVGFPRPLMRQKSSKDSRKGPYQLLIKERLMGIYMAIYIHRDLKPFVRGLLGPDFWIESHAHNLNQACLNRPLLLDLLGVE